MGQEQEPKPRAPEQSPEEPTATPGETAGEDKKKKDGKERRRKLIDGIKNRRKSGQGQTDAISKHRGSGGE